MRLTFDHQWAADVAARYMALHTGDVYIVVRRPRLFRRAVWVVRKVDAR